jgi:Rap1a immunity proteins
VVTSELSNLIRHRWRLRGHVTLLRAQHSTHHLFPAEPSSGVSFRVLEKASTEDVAVKISFSLVLLLLAACMSASAESTGNDVLKSCQAAVRFADNDGAPVSEHFDSGWCFGWVSGALEITKLHNEWTDFTGQKPTLLQFCLPESGIPVIQAVRIVVQYLKEHPEQLHEDGMSLTIAALKDSFPCGKQH